ncbi:MAG TPA: biopolymer transporter ExbD [Planctomycetota bacterium]|nr:biopolymer transporter ExbD [Planctomycetota bacterium]
MKGMVYRKRLGKGRYTLQMAPMVDVVFLLLIFFLVASKIQPAEAAFKADLPGDGRHPRPPEVSRLELVRVHLRNLDVAGETVEVSLNGEVLGGDPFRTLTSRLLAADGSNMRLVIDGDPDVKVTFIATVLDAASAARVKQVVFREPRRDAETR